MAVILPLASVVRTVTPATPFTSVQTRFPFLVGAVSVLGATREIQRFVKATGNAEYGLYTLTTFHTAGQDACLKNHRRSVGLAEAALAAVAKGVCPAIFGLCQHLAWRKRRR